jgi:hypothetical protein
MKTIIADVIARPYDCGGLPWGLWNHIILYLCPVGSPVSLSVTVKGIEVRGFDCERGEHTLTFGFDEQNLDQEWMDIGTQVEVWFDKWQHSADTWQTKSPVADGVVTYIL